MSSGEPTSARDPSRRRMGSHSYVAVVQSKLPGGGYGEPPRRRRRPDTAPRARPNLPQTTSPEPHTLRSTSPRPLRRRNGVLAEACWGV